MESITVLFGGLVKIFLSISGHPITKNDIELNVPDGLRHQSFNAQLQNQFQQLVFEIEKNDKQKQKELLEIKTSLFKKIALFIPGFIGWLLHAPLYFPIKKFVYQKTKNNDHFDSIIIALLLFAYPIYLLLITILLFVLIKNYWIFLLLLILPFTAWSYVQVKEQLDR